MLKLELNNSNVNIFHDSLKDKIENIQSRQLPNFAKHSQNLNVIEKISKEAKNFKNIILCSNQYYETESLNEIFPELFKNKIFCCNIGDVSKINLIKKYLNCNESLLIFVAEQSDMLSVGTLLSLKEFPCIIVTRPKEHFIYEIARQKKLSVVDMPPLQKEFSTASITTLLPLKLCGFPIEEFLEGIKESHENFSNNIALEKNLALQAALSTFILEAKGYTEVLGLFWPSKIKSLCRFWNFLGNKICKNERGQTFIGSYLFDGNFLHRLKEGRKNAVAFFVTSKEANIKAEIPKEFFALSNDPIIKEIKNKTMQEIISEFEKNFDNKISLQIEKITPYTIGEFVGFMHWFSMYGIWLRDIMQ